MAGEAREMAAEYSAATHAATDTADTADAAHTGETAAAKAAESARVGRLRGEGGDDDTRRGSEIKCLSA
jgi:hypothetical protein